MGARYRIPSSLPRHKTVREEEGSYKAIILGEAFIPSSSSQKKGGGGEHGGKVG